MASSPAPGSSTWSSSASSAQSLASSLRRYFALNPAKLGGPLPLGAAGVGQGVYLALFPLQGFEVLPVAAGETGESSAQRAARHHRRAGLFHVALHPGAGGAGRQLSGPRSAVSATARRRGSPPRTAHRPGRARRQPRLDGRLHRRQRPRLAALRGGHRLPRPLAAAPRKHPPPIGPPATSPSGSPRCSPPCWRSCSSTGSSWG